MKVITLTDIIRKECKNKKFASLFQRELLINEIAETMTKLRKQAKLTQAELAKRAKTTQAVVARLECGTDRRIPSLLLLTKLALAANAKIKISIERIHQ